LWEDLFGKYSSRGTFCAIREGIVHKTEPIASDHGCEQVRYSPQQGKHPAALFPSNEPGQIPDEGVEPWGAAELRLSKRRLPVP
ncbi:MAG: hypothetical protein Q8L05_01645, partial [Actinomycetota bacterium]|nr:hypothetical protein [Actinomycetota bacterium]